MPRASSGLLTLATLFTLAALPTLASCGPKSVTVQGAQVKETVVRPRGGAPAFCPGSTLEVELVAQLQNGETCSTHTPGRCGGNDSAVLDMNQVVITASDGVFDPKTFTVRTSPDALSTADGLLLRGWVVGGEATRASTTLRPVYECMGNEEAVADAGEPGPHIEVAATRIKTPYYPQLTLVRVRIAGLPAHYLLVPPTAHVRVIARGGDGFAGQSGSAGHAGSPGASASSSCENGGAGGQGGAGGPGGPGGDGGRGGVIVAVIDQDRFAEINSQLELYAPGGAAGSGGAGGAGGAGGQGGSAGSSDSKNCPSGGTHGTQGPNGAPGPQGPAGRPGMPGPMPQKIAASLQTLFAAELGRIDQLSRGTPKK